MIAAISGSGVLTGSMVGTVQFAADLAGVGDMSASLAMLSGLIATLAGQGLISADLKGKLAMEAQIYVNQSEATVQQLVDGVWNAEATDYDESGTLGDKLNSAGGAADPWDDTRALTVGKFLGLK
jgi:hypothetical protein